MGVGAGIGKGVGRGRRHRLLHQRDADAARRLRDLDIIQMIVFCRQESDALFALLCQFMCSPKAVVCGFFLVGIMFVSRLSAPCVLSAIPTIVAIVCVFQVHGKNHGRKDFALLA